MNYISECLQFMAEESKACKKEMWRLLRLGNKGHNDEGQTINNAEAKSVNKDGYTTLKYPPQFTKLREEKKVEIYSFDDKKKVTDAEVVSVDYLKGEIVLDTSLNLKEKYIIIQSLEVAPYAIINSLKKMREEGSSRLSNNLMNKIHNIKVYGKGEPDPKNIYKTVDEMNDSWMIMVGPPGTGKTFTAKGIVAHLLKKKKKIAITSNSHSAINNLMEAIEFKKFDGAKICSRSHHGVDHKQIKNISVYGKDIDGYVSGYDVVGGTCFALSRVNEVKFDYLIVDEASQLKMSFLLGVSKIAHNVIILGDPSQLQSISILEETSGGESVLNYLMGKKKIVTSEGYFLNKTYRMEPKIAKVISDVFYQGKLGWAQSVPKDGVTLITSNHTHGQKMSEEEADDVSALIKKLKKQKVPSEEIMVITPYNAQVSLIKSKVTDKKVRISTVDMFQGQEAEWVIISMVAAGNKKDSSEFVTNGNRLNVAISRAKSGCFLVASKGLQVSEFASNEFKQVLKMIA